MKDPQTITQAGYSLIERWSDDEAVLLNERSGAYELWRVAAGAEASLVIDAPHDGRSYERVRAVTEFELNDDEVAGIRAERLGREANNERHAGPSHAPPLGRPRKAEAAKGTKASKKAGKGSAL